MRRPLLALILLSVIVLSVGADDAPKPKSQAAVAAIKKSEGAIAKAEEAFRAAKLAALRQLVTDLKAAQAQAMKGGGVAALDEATAIKYAIEQAEADIDAIGNAGKSQRFVVKAGREWTETIAVSAGQTFTAKITGQWVHGPSRDAVASPVAIVNGNRLGPIGRIGNGPTFPINSEPIVADSDGTLFIRLDGGDWQNDKGAVTANITAE